MTQEKTFEASLKELETIVAQLERADQPLDSQLKAFEEGVRLSRHCLGHLEIAERQVELLTADDNGQPKKTPFAAE